MSVTIAEVLTNLGIDEWVIRGEPATEDEFNSMFRKVTGADANGAAIESSNPADFGVTWSQIIAKQTELNNAAPMKELRRQRDIKLSETDWWASSDLTITDAQKKYRQDLRDITKSATSLDDVTWPEKP